MPLPARSVLRLLAHEMRVVALICEFLKAVLLAASNQPLPTELQTSPANMKSTKSALTGAQYKNKHKKYY